MTSANSERARLPTRASGFIVPAVIWAVWFVSIYSLQGAGCSAGLQEMELAGIDALRALLAALLVIALLAIGLFGVAAWRASRRSGQAVDSNGGRRQFYARLTVLSSALFLVATLWVGLGVFFLPPCQ